MQPAQALSAMLASQCAAAAVVQKALSDIEAAARLVASALGQGATLHYAAAGSSGLMALADACELPGTFQVPQTQIKVHMAGGVPADGVMPGDTEDSTDDAARAAGSVSSGDVAIVISASGTTPYALSFAKAARHSGAKTIAIANKAGSELLTLGDVAILLDTPPEVLEGSTRLGAGTAQKIALNMISTQAAVLLGHVHEGLMVNLNPDNMKLRQRACDIVAKIVGVSGPEAEEALKVTGFDTKAATLVARGVALGEAKALLDRNKGHLRACLGEMDARTKTTN
ncbi:MAG: N-acetylmuramic acid 6-phosphate etherase [Silicimonas sp.]|nr:N-acetylmuramic acid 6-phosphate etherase [Silicimonas sp.]